MFSKIVHNSEEPLRIKVLFQKVTDEYLILLNNLKDWPKKNVLILFCVKAGIFCVETSYKQPLTWTHPVKRL